MRTQVCIIGGGPSGLLLGQLLLRQGVEAIVLERQSKAHVLSRIRAGILERGAVELLRRAGVADRLDREAFLHDGASFSHDNEAFRLDFKERAGQSVVLYGQTEVTRDLYDARHAAGGQTIFSVDDVIVDGADQDVVTVRYRQGDRSAEIVCDYVAGCDGFHGVSRKTIPAAHRREYEKVYPFGWLGVLSETPPVDAELLYANSSRGFALCSMRNANLSRYYIQCPLDTQLDDWSDDEFWDELKRRIPEMYAERLVTGPTIEKSVAPLRSFVCEPMQWGRLFICGDAAHIVPPTGAKGLNAAAADVHYLSEALLRYYNDQDGSDLAQYSNRALARVWKIERFSWATTNMLHRYPDQSDFDLKMQRAEIDFLRTNVAAQTAFAENYVGLPY